MCTILAQSFFMIICRRGGENYEQKIIFEGDGDGRGGNGAKMFAYLFHWWYYNNVAIFYLCLLSHAYHMEFQLVKKSSLDVTVFFLIYMEKLLHSNSGSNKEATRYYLWLGRDGVVNMYSTYWFLEIMRNNQFWMYLGNEWNMIAKFFDTGFTCDATLYT